MTVYGKHFNLWKAAGDAWYQLPFSERESGSPSSWQDGYVYGRIAEQDARPVENTAPTGKVLAYVTLVGISSRTDDDLGVEAVRTRYATVDEAVEAWNRVLTENGMFVRIADTLFALDKIASVEFVQENA